MIPMSELFETYVVAIYGGRDRIHEIQYTELRRAFLAGAHMGMVHTVAIPNDGGTEADMVERLDQLLDKTEDEAKAAFATGSSPAPAPGPDPGCPPSRS